MSFPYDKHGPTDFIHWLWRTDYNTPCGVSDSFLEAYGEWQTRPDGYKFRDWKYRTEDIDKVTCPYCIAALPDLLSSMIAFTDKNLEAVQRHRAHLDALVAKALRKQGSSGT
jgi:hypothetical protein